MLYEAATLRDGTQVWLRPMIPDDCAALVALFATAADEEVLYLRDDIRDQAVVQGWCAALDYGRVLPLVAWADDRAVGQASLHFGCGPERHCGKVRVFVAPEFRRRGLGTALLHALADVAGKHGLHFLLAEVVIEQARVIRTFMKAGYQLCFTLPDAFMFRDGGTRDLTILRLCLRPPCAEPGVFAPEESA
jgi:GNAT superfamily N-acetyltransferase